MIAQGRNQILSRSQWAAPLAIFCIVFVLLLISGTIILSLIPLYLRSKDINANISQNAIPFNVVYASNVKDGRSLTLSNINDVSAQMLKNIRYPKNTMEIQSGQFLPATASDKKKRQTSNVAMTCEQATGLLGDLFVMEYMMKYPPMYSSSSSQERYRNSMQNAFRENTRQITVTMSFDNGETRNIQLAFCSFSTPVISTTTSPSESTSATSTCIYLLDQDNNFFQFHPTTFDVTFIGTINCSTTAYAYSMALQRNGTAWTLFTDGNLYTFDVKTAQCQPTSYLFDQGGIILFGMNFATDESDNTERLYISTDSSDPPFRLATIDVDSLEISVIGYYDTVYARGELTSTNDGRLFGLFEGTPFIVAEINRTNGEILSKTSQNMIQYTSDSSYFAFTSYLSNFFLFVGNFSYTDIFFYSSSTQTTTKQKTISYGIVGAGISTCVGDI